MKQGIHPTWYDDCKVTCNCGNTFVIGSNQQTLEIDICNKCHPFFTGEVKFVDRQGRVDKFKQKVATAQATKPTKKKKKAQESTDEVPKSYRDLLRDQQAQMRKSAKPKTEGTQKAQTK